jgi:hypothetical protein
MGAVGVQWVFVYLVMGLPIVALFVLTRNKNKVREAPRDFLAEKIASLHKVDGFTPAIVHKGFVTSYGLALDPASDQFAIAIPGHEPRLYHFSQLIAAEVEKDSETITTTRGKASMKGAAVAVALVGPLGLLMGAKTTSTSRDRTTMKSLILKLYVNDLYTPCFDIPFLLAPGFQTEAAIKEIDQWYGRFRTILAGVDRVGFSNASELAVRHLAPAPEPAAIPWAARVFAP